MRASVVSLWAFWSALASAAPASPDATEAVEVTRSSGEVNVWGGAELATASFPVGIRGGKRDLFGIATPMFGVSPADFFLLEVGPELRFRLIDSSPHEPGNDLGGSLRGADWDELSDFGQVLRDLRLGPEGGTLSFKAGKLAEFTLGHGHVISRYENRLNPDYHPAGARLVGYAGPVKLESVASDFLGARLFAGELALDVGAAAQAGSDWRDRVHFSLSGGHDAGRAGGLSQPVTVLHSDIDLTVFRGDRVTVTLLGGAGGRAGARGLGALAGLGLEGRPGSVALGGRAEVRAQSGSFRQGMFGPDWELARFASVGTSAAPRGVEQLPRDSASAYAELFFGAGKEGKGSVLSIAAERFFWGRTDGDLAWVVHGFDGKLLASLRAIVSGLGEVPRWSVASEARYRFVPSLYALANGGVLFFPQPDSTLVRGTFLGAGIGADFEG